jgi:hypothetical protein
VPPLALNVALYEEPTCPAPNAAELMLSAAGAVGTGVITIEYVTVLFCALDSESVTVTLKAEVSLTLGVPEITPPLDSVSPVGRLPDETAHLYGVVPPDAPRVTLYATPTCPLGSCVVVIDNVSDESGAVVTVSGTWFDCDPSEFRTCNCATAGCASVVPLMFAAIVVEFTTVVGTAVPFTVSAACD